MCICWSRLLGHGLAFGQIAIICARCRVLRPGRVSVAERVGEVTLQHFTGGPLSACLLAHGVRLTLWPLCRV